MQGTSGALFLNYCSERSSRLLRAPCVSGADRQNGMSDNLPAAVIAYREYVIPAPGGGTANIAFTLRRAGTAPPGDFAPRTDARAHGLVSLVDYPGAPRHPAMWEQSDSGLRLTAADQDRDLSPEISQLIARYLAVFFNDVAAVAPDLAAVRPRCAAAAPSRAPAATAEQADSGYPRLEEHIRRYEAESESARFFYKSAKYVEWACISLVPAAALVHGPTAAALGAIVIVLEGLQPLNG